MFIEVYIGNIINVKITFGNTIILKFPSYYGAIKSTDAVVPFPFYEYL